MNQEFFEELLLLTFQKIELHSVAITIFKVIAGISINSLI